MGAASGTDLLGATDGIYWAYNWLRGAMMGSKGLRCRQTHLVLARTLGVASDLGLPHAAQPCQPIDGPDQFRQWQRSVDVT